MASKKSSKTAKKAASAKKVAPAKKSAAKKLAPAKKATKKGAAKKGASRKHRHPVVHWEIQSRDAKRLHRFYADVFDWSIETNNPMGYGMVASGGAEGIDGGIGDSPIKSSRVVVYTSVPSINDTLARIASHGGKTVLPRQDMGMVVLALYQDPEGNVLGLVED